MDRDELPREKPNTSVAPLTRCWFCPIRRCLFAPCFDDEPQPFAIRCKECSAHLIFWYAGTFYDPNARVEFSRNRLNQIMKYNNSKPGLNSKLQVRSSDHKFPSSKTQGLELECRVYEPVDNAGPLQVLVWYHGGGFCLMTAEERGMDLLCQKLCARSRIMVVSVSYRLAPEDPFPCAVHDCMDALKWISTQPVALQRADFTKGIVLAGDSAGGNLACVMSSLLRDGLDSDLTLLTVKVPRIVQQVLVYPSLFMGVDKEVLKNEPRAFLPEPVTYWFIESYIPGFIRNGATTGERRLSPIAAGFANMPNTVIVSAGKDILRHDNFMALEAFKAAGVNVKHFHYAKVPHGFATMHNFQECDEAVDAISQSLF